MQWEAITALCALTALLGAFLRWVIRATVKEVLSSNGNGYQKVKACDGIQQANERRFKNIEHNIFSKSGYVRSRIHEVANRAGIKLLVRDEERAQESARAAATGDI